MISNAIGMIPPNDNDIGDFCCHDHYRKVASPSMLEIELANKKHRWKEIKKIQEKLFWAFKREVEKYERDAMKLFKLPSYDEIIREEIGQYITIQNRPFSVSESQLISYRRLIAEWQDALIGTSKLLETEDQNKSKVIERDFFTSAIVDQYFSDFKTNLINASSKRISVGGAMVMPIFQSFLLQAFAISIKKTISSIRASLIEYYIQNGLNQQAAEQATERVIREEVIPQLRNTYLMATVVSGGNRIRTILSESMLRDVKNELIRMSKDGKGVIEVARFLHKKFGGQLWYWNRIARSEVVLAYSAAFRAQAEAAKVKYVTWSAASTACDLCAALDGRTWKFNEPYPEPVVSTHPHCLCILIPRYTMPEGQRLQPAWDLPSPYDQEGRRQRNIILEEMDWDQYFDSIAGSIPYRQE